MAEKRKNIGGIWYVFRNGQWEVEGSGNSNFPGPDDDTDPGTDTGTKYLYNDQGQKIGERVLVGYANGQPVYENDYYNDTEFRLINGVPVPGGSGGGRAQVAPTTYGATRIIDLPGGYKAIQQDTNYGPQIIEIIPPGQYLDPSKIPAGYLPVYDSRGNVTDIKPDPNFVGVEQKLSQQRNQIQARGQDVTAQGNVLSALGTQGNLASQLDPFGQATVLMGGGRGGTTPFEQWARMFAQAIAQAQGQLNPILPYEPLFPTATAEGGYYGDPRSQRIRVHEGETVITDRIGRLQAIIPKEDTVRPTMSARQGFTSNEILRSQQSGLAEQVGTPGTQNDIATPSPGTVVTKEAEATPTTGGVLTMPDGTTYSPSGGAVATAEPAARPPAPGFEILPSSFTAKDRQDIMNAGLDPSSPTALTDLRTLGAGVLPGQPTPESVFQNQGELFRDKSTGAVYILIGNQLHWIPNGATFEAFGLDWNNIKNLDSAEHGIFNDPNIQMGAPLRAGDQYSGRPQLFSEQGDPTVYILDTSTGIIHHVTDLPTFEQSGLQWADVQHVPKGFLKHFPGFGEGSKWKVTDIQNYLERSAKGPGSEKEIDFFKKIQDALNEKVATDTPKGKSYVGDADKALLLLRKGLATGEIRGNDTKALVGILENLIRNGELHRARLFMNTVLQQGFAGVGATPDETELDILKDILKDFAGQEWAPTVEGSGDVPTFQDEILGTGGTIIPGTGVTLPPLSQLSRLWPTLNGAQKEALSSAYFRFGGIEPAILQEYINRFALPGARAPQIIGYG